MSRTASGRWRLDAETAADLFRPYEIRQVRRGTVSLGKGVYYHRELDLGDWHGRQVLVGYDIHDPKHVWVRDLEERLICVATLGANRAAYFPKSRVEQARERRERGRLKRLERKAEEIRAEAMGPAIEFRPEEAVEIPLSTEAQARLDRIAAGADAPSNADRTVFELPRDPAEKMRIWREIDARRSAGEEISEREEKFWRGWRTSPEHRAQLRMEEMMARGALARPKKEGPA